MIDWRNLGLRWLGHVAENGDAMRPHDIDARRASQAHERHALHERQYRLAEALVAELGVEVDLDRFRAPLGARRSDVSYVDPRD